MRSSIFPRRPWLLSLGVGCECDKFRARQALPTWRDLSVALCFRNVEAARSDYIRLSVFFDAARLRVVRNEMTSSQSDEVSVQRMGNRCKSLTMLTLDL